MIVHVVTNYTHCEGAQRMLGRLVKHEECERIKVVSLLEVSEQMKLPHGNRDVEYVALHMRSPLAMLNGIRKLAQLIKVERPRTLVCWMYHAMVVGTIAAKWSGSNPLLFWNVRQSLDDPSALSLGTRAAVALARPLSRFADGIIYNSARARQLHAAAGFADSNAAVIPNGFELPHIEVIKPHKATIFGVAARFHAQKDHANFFRAAHRVSTVYPKARFVAAGRGVSWQNPECAAAALAAGMTPEVLDLRGEVANMAEFYTSIDALVLPSRTEGFPNVIGEAMSHGLPVVTTDVGDAAVVVSDAGFVVPPRNDEALAAAMQKVMELSSTDYASYSSRARKRVETHFALNHIVKEYRDFLAAGRRPSGGGIASGQGV